MNIDNCIHSWLLGLQGVVACLSRRKSDGFNPRRSRLGADNEAGTSYLASNARRITRRVYSGSSTGRASALQAEGCGFKSRLEYLGNVAQSAERLPVKQDVTGSSPVGPALGTWRNRWRRCLIRIRLRVRFPAFLRLLEPSGQLSSILSRGMISGCSSIWQNAAFGTQRLQVQILSFRYGAVAQLGEHLPCKQGVGSSSLLGSIIQNAGLAQWKSNCFVISRLRVQVPCPA